MEYIEFGTQKARVSKVMLGLMRIDSMSVEEVSELVQGALEEGINALDIADVYGLGKCESILGEVFKANPGLRDKFFLQTKFGIRKEESGFTWYDFSKDYLVEAADACLERLGVDHVDCLLLHRPDVLMIGEDVAEVMDGLMASGKILDWGVSNQNPATMNRIARYAKTPMVTTQMQLSCAFAPAFDAFFNVNMENDEAIMREGGVFEHCLEHDMVIQTWSAFQYGYFGGSFLGSDKYPELNAVLERIGAEQGVSSAAVALAWILRFPAKMQAVIGTTKLHRVQDSAKACDVTLTEREWYEIYQAAGKVMP